AGCVLALRRWLRRPIVREEVYAPRLGTLPRRVGVTVAIVSFLVIGVRGSLGRRPMQLKDAAITRDAFLNKAVVNPYPALRYAFQQHRFLTAAHGVEAYLPGGDVRAAARLLFGKKDAPADLDGFMLARAKGPVGPGARPRHIFAIFVESYDAWPLLDKYSSLGLAGEMKRLARDGLHVKRFLPSSVGTMSIGVIITGLPDAGVHVNYRNSGDAPYPTAIAPIMKRLGYRTRLFYGGYLSWQRIGDFAREQGFDEVYGGAHMGSYGVTNEWGVDDEYDVDVRAKGFPLREVPEDVKASFDGTVDLNTLGHLWYADRCVGGFVDDMTRKLTRPVFALTGDHFSRRFLNARPDFFERSAVPLVLYGPEVLQGLALPAGAAGSHVDIAPTLIELSAPQGFEYHAAGRSVLDPGTRGLGVGSGTAVGPGFMVDVV
ncbi:MAG: LTA synthase family protein, partial [Planctomycetota bacterium]